MVNSECSFVFMITSSFILLMLHLVSSLTSFVGEEHQQRRTLQEYDKHQEYDSYGRFQFKNSYQSKLNIVQSNTVQYCFDKIAEKLKIPRVTNPTCFYIITRH